ncbi:MAG: SusC/RagA family TonB-linked outer membrane protein, partial [Saprospiraceae bacterium]|nr:SusC/RagA family TonB-linked outer membrane protein [Saprospiraceae bacterium]
MYSILTTTDRNRWCNISVLVFFLLGFCFTANAQNVNVEGRVYAEDSKEALPGVNITIKGTTNGTITDVDGYYSINVSSDATLVFSFLGYKTQEITVNNSRTIDVTLAIDATSLDEVVVIGYGTQRKRDVTGSVTSVSESELKEVPAPNLITQLKGRAAGVSIVSNGSTPGSSGQIRIRGNRTITNSQGASDGLDGPLLVVDGIPFPGSINDLNPEDIASLDILKDASATAIYGSRGAGGVLLITTKRGRSDRTVISYDSYVGFSNILDKYDVYNGQEYAQLKADAAKYNRSTPGTTSYALTQAEQEALDAGVSTDWQDLIYETGVMTNHQLSVSGGNESTQYGLGGGYFLEGGIVPNQKFERFSLRTTIDHRINKTFKLGLNSLNTLSYSNTPGGGGVPSGLVRLTPLASPYDANGDVNLFPAIGSIDANSISPLTLITKEDAILAQNRRLRTFNSLYGEIRIAEGLRYRFNAGLDYRQDNGSGYNGILTYVNNAQVQSSSNASISNSEAWSYNLQNLLYYDKTFGAKHKIGFIGLFEVTKDHFKGSRFTVTGVPADYIKNSNFSLAAGQPVADPNGNSFSEVGLISYMGRLNYSFANKYLVTVTYRVDGSSTLAPGNQYFTYPAFGLGWNLSEESFLKDNKLISNLKIRGGWGISGNRNVGAYSTLGSLSSNFYNFGTSVAGQQLGYLVTDLANSSLGWQSTNQWDVGLEFGLFKDRITGSIDVYEQNTKDILLQVSLPPSNGAGSTFKNLGKTRGRGLEAALTGVNVRTNSGFEWETDLNFFFSREEITELTTPAEMQNIGNGWFVGQPLNVIYDYKKIGIWQLADKESGALAKQTSPVQFPGQIRVEDVNGDGKIDANDRQILGNFQPDWE